MHNDEPNNIFNLCPGGTIFCNRAYFGMIGLTIILLILITILLILITILLILILTVILLLLLIIIIGVWEREGEKEEWPLSVR